MATCADDDKPNEWHEYGEYCHASVVAKLEVDIVHGDNAKDGTDDIEDRYDCQNCPEARFATDFEQLPIVEDWHPSLPRRYTSFFEEFTEEYRDDGVHE